MAVVKITEKTVADSVDAGAYILITQEEEVGGEPVEALRRAALEDVLNAYGLSVNSDGKLCALIEEG